MTAAKFPSLLLGWTVAFLISALLVSAGRHWPDPLPVVAWQVWVLVLTPPLLMGAWIASRWGRVPAVAAGPGGEDGDEGQSCNSSHAQD
ncbi:hypothetical protein FQK07_03810 [Synechococcus sp. BSF8S]|uniref:hypothetical protein n=1 Tax=Synechococcales TaxID=1890424 RepID=UPI0016266444|nr:hypothetical protein [Synechococcus sp. BSF8S]MBC1260403.1 hypothetical protein [Synechococcus sp. BSF8S]